jgi:hypothetical protein
LLDVYCSSVFIFLLLTVVVPFFQDETWVRRRLVVSFVQTLTGSSVMLSYKTTLPKEVHDCPIIKEGAVVDDVVK